MEEAEEGEEAGDRASLAPCGAGAGEGAAWW